MKRLITVAILMATLPATAHANNWINGGRCNATSALPDPGLVGVVLYRTCLDPSINSYKSGGNLL